MSILNLFPSYEEARINTVKLKADHAQNLPKVFHFILSKSPCPHSDLQDFTLFVFVSNHLSYFIILTSTPPITALSLFSSFLTMPACLQLRLLPLTLLLSTVVFPQISL